MTVLRIDRTPGHADAGLRQKPCVVGGEERIANVRIRVDDAVGEGVVGGAIVGFVPAGRKFVTKAERQREVATDANDVFGVQCAEKERQLSGVGVGS